MKLSFQRLFASDGCFQPQLEQMLSYVRFLYSLKWYIVENNLLLFVSQHPRAGDGGEEVQL